MMLCDAVQVPEIIITNEIENIKGHWFHTNRTFNYREVAIKLSTFTAYRSTFRLEKFLKRLHFQGDHLDYKQLNLNNLTQLEELKLDFIIPDGTDELSAEVSDINLPNLRILDIAGIDPTLFDFDLKIVLITPKLEKLKYDFFTSMSLAHPDTIDHLEVRDDDDDVLSEIGHSLTNVQYLKFDQNIPWNDDILLKFPKLKTLMCNLFDSDDYEAGLYKLGDLVEQKSILNRPEVRIFYQSVELVNGDKINDFESAKSILAFQMNNYNTLCDSISYDDNHLLHYNELMELVKGNLPDDFFHKYRHIPSIFVSEEVSQEHCLQFLIRLEYLQNLHIRNESLEQSFYDGLCEINQLTELHVENTSSLIISYDFLFKLKLLEEFVTNCDLSELLDLTLALFIHLKNFKKINFFCHDALITICNNVPYSNGYRLTRQVHQGTWRYPLFEIRNIDFVHLSHLVNQLKNDRMVELQ